MRLKSLLLLCFLGIIVIAQDSRTEKLGAKAREYSSYPDSLINIGNRLLKIDAAKARYEGYFALGLGNSRKGNSVIALENYKKALVIARAKLPDSDQMQARKNYALSLRKVNRTDEAFSHLDTNLQMAVAAKDSFQINSSHLNMGVLNRLLGNYEEAIEQYQNAARYISESDSRRFYKKGFLWLNIGTVYGSKQAYEESLPWFHRAYQQATLGGNEDLQSRALNNLGYSFYKMNTPDSSVFYYLKTGALQRKLNNTGGLKLTYQNLAENYVSLEDRPKARAYTDSMLALTNSKNQIDAARSFLIAGKYFQFAEQPEIALLYADSCLAFAKNGKTIDLTITAYRLKSSILESLGQLENALQLDRRAQVLRDSVQKYRDIKSIHASSSNILLSEKEKEAEQIEREKTYNRNLAIAVAVIALLMAGLVLYFVQRNKQKKKSLEEKESAISELQDQVKEVNDALEGKRLLLKSKAIVPLDKLIYIESEGHYINLYLEDKKESERAGLRQTLEDLPSTHFVQIHRSYVVNIDYIRAIYSDRVLMTNGQELKVSRTFKANVEELKNQGDFD